MNSEHHREQAVGSVSLSFLLSKTGLRGLVTRTTRARGYGGPASPRHIAGRCSHHGSSCSSVLASRPRQPLGRALALRLEVGWRGTGSNALALSEEAEAQGGEKVKAGQDLHPPPHPDASSKPQCTGAASVGPGCSRRSETCVSAPYVWSEHLPCGGHLPSAHPSSPAQAGFRGRGPTKFSFLLSF